MREKCLPLMLLIATAAVLIKADSFNSAEDGLRPSLCCILWGDVGCQKKCSLLCTAFRCISWNPQCNTVFCDCQEKLPIRFLGVVPNAPDSVDLPPDVTFKQLMLVKFMRTPVFRDLDNVMPTIPDEELEVKKYLYSTDLSGKDLKQELKRRFPKLRYLFRRLRPRPLAQLDPNVSAEVLKEGINMEEVEEPPSTRSYLSSWLKPKPKKTDVNSPENQKRIIELIKKLPYKHDIVETFETLRDSPEKPLYKNICRYFLREGMQSPDGTYIVKPTTDPSELEKKVQSDDIIRQLQEKIDESNEQNKNRKRKRPVASAENSSEEDAKQLNQNHPTSGSSWWSPSLWGNGQTPGNANMPAQKPPNTSQSTAKPSGWWWGWGNGKSLPKDQQSGQPGTDSNNIPNGSPMQSNGPLPVQGQNSGKPWSWPSWNWSNGSSSQGANMPNLAISPPPGTALIPTGTPSIITNSGSTIDLGEVINPSPDSLPKKNSKKVKRKKLRKIDKTKDLSEDVFPDMESIDKTLGKPKKKHHKHKKGESKEDSPNCKHKKHKKQKHSPDGDDSDSDESSSEEIAPQRTANRHKKKKRPHKNPSTSNENTKDGIAPSGVQSGKHKKKKKHHKEPKDDSDSDESSSEEIELQGSPPKHKKRKHKPNDDEISSTLGNDFKLKKKKKHSNSDESDNYDNGNPAGKVLSSEAPSTKHKKNRKKPGQSIPTSTNDTESDEISSEEIVPEETAIKQKKDEPKLSNQSMPLPLDDKNSDISSSEEISPDGTVIKHGKKKPSKNKQSESDESSLDSEPSSPPSITPKNVSASSTVFLNTPEAPNESSDESKDDEIVPKRDPKNSQDSTFDVSTDYSPLLDSVPESKPPSSVNGIPITSKSDISNYPSTRLKPSADFTGTSMMPKILTPGNDSPINSKDSSPNDVTNFPTTMDPSFANLSGVSNPKGLESSIPLMMNPFEPMSLGINTPPMSQQIMASLPSPNNMLPIDNFLGTNVTSGNIPGHTSRSKNENGLNNFVPETPKNILNSISSSMSPEDLIDLKGIDKHGNPIPGASLQKLLKNIPSNSMPISISSLSSEKPPEDSPFINPLGSNVKDVDVNPMTGGPLQTSLINMKSNSLSPLTAQPSLVNTPDQSSITGPAVGNPPQSNDGLLPDPQTSLVSSTLDSNNHPADLLSSPSQSLSSQNLSPEKINEFAAPSTNAAEAERPKVPSGIFPSLSSFWSGPSKLPTTFNDLVSPIVNSGIPTENSSLSQIVPSSLENQPILSGSIPKELSGLLSSNQLEPSSKTPLNKLNTPDHLTKGSESAMNPSTPINAPVQLINKQNPFDTSFHVNSPLQEVLISDLKSSLPSNVQELLQNQQNPLLSTSDALSDSPSTNNTLSSMKLASPFSKLTQLLEKQNPLGISDDSHEEMDHEMETSHEVPTLKSSSAPLPGVFHGGSGSMLSKLKNNILGNPLSQPGVTSPDKSGNAVTSLPHQLDQESTSDGSHPIMQKGSRDLSDHIPESSEPLLDGAISSLLESTSDGSHPIMQKESSDLSDHIPESSDPLLDGAISSLSESTSDGSHPIMQKGSTDLSDHIPESSDPLLDGAISSLPESTSDGSHPIMQKGSRDLSDHIPESSDPLLNGAISSLLESTSDGSHPIMQKGSRDLSDHIPESSDPLLNGAISSLLESTSDGSHPIMQKGSTDLSDHIPESSDPLLNGAISSLLESTSNGSHPIMQKGSRDLSDHILESSDPLLDGAISSLPESTSDGSHPIMQKESSDLSDHILESSDPLLDGAISSLPDSKNSQNAALNSFIGDPNKPTLTTESTSFVSHPSGSNTPKDISPDSMQTSESTTIAPSGTDSSHPDKSELKGYNIPSPRNLLKNKLYTPTSYMSPSDDSSILQKSSSDPSVPSVSLSPTIAEVKQLLNKSLPPSSMPSDEKLKALVDKLKAGTPSSDPSIQNISTSPNVVEMKNLLSSDFPPGSMPSDEQLKELADKLKLRTPSSDSPIQNISSSPSVTEIKKLLSKDLPPESMPSNEQLKAIVNKLKSGALPDSSTSNPSSSTKQSQNDAFVDALVDHLKATNPSIKSPDLSTNEGPIPNQGISKNLISHQPQDSLQSGDEPSPNQKTTSNADSTPILKAKSIPNNSIHQGLVNKLESGNSPALSPQNSPISTNDSLFLQNNLLQNPLLGEINSNDQSIVDGIPSSNEKLSQSPLFSNLISSDISSFSPQPLNVPSSLHNPSKPLNKSFDNDLNFEPSQKSDLLTTPNQPSKMKTSNPLDSLPHLASSNSISNSLPLKNSSDTLPSSTSIPSGVNSSTPASKLPNTSLSELSSSPLDKPLISDVTNSPIATKTIVDHLPIKLDDSSGLPSPAAPKENMSSDQLPTKGNSSPVAGLNIDHNISLLLPLNKNINPLSLKSNNTPSSLKDIDNPNKDLLKSISNPKTMSNATPFMDGSSFLPKNNSILPSDLNSAPSIPPASSLPSSTTKSNQDLPPENSIVNIPPTGDHPQIDSSPEMHGNISSNKKGDISNVESDENSRSTQHEKNMPLSSLSPILMPTDGNPFEAFLTDSTAHPTKDNSIGALPPLKNTKDTQPSILPDETISPGPTPSITDSSTSPFSKEGRSIDSDHQIPSFDNSIDEENISQTISASPNMTSMPENVDGSSISLPTQSHPLGDHSDTALGSPATRSEPSPSSSNPKFASLFDKLKNANSSPMKNNSTPSKIPNIEAFSSNPLNNNLIPKHANPALLFNDANTPIKMASSEGDSHPSNKISSIGAPTKDDIIDNQLPNLSSDQLSIPNGINNAFKSPFTTLPAKPLDDLTDSPFNVMNSPTPLSTPNGKTIFPQIPILAKPEQSSSALPIAKPDMASLISNPPTTAHRKPQSPLSNNQLISQLPLSGEKSNLNPSRANPSPIDQLLVSAPDNGISGSQSSSSPTNKPIIGSGLPPLPSQKDTALHLQQSLDEIAPLIQPTDGAVIPKNVMPQDMLSGALAASNLLSGSSPPSNNLNKVTNPDSINNLSPKENNIAGNGSSMSQPTTGTQNLPLPSTQFQLQLNKSSDLPTNKPNIIPLNNSSPITANDIQPPPAKSMGSSAIKTPTRQQIGKVPTPSNFKPQIPVLPSSIPNSIAVIPVHPDSISKPSAPSNPTSLDKQSPTPHSPSLPSQSPTPIPTFTPSIPLAHSSPPLNEEEDSLPMTDDEIDISDDSMEFLHNRPKPSFKSSTKPSSNFSGKPQSSDLNNSGSPTSVPPLPLQAPNASKDSDSTNNKQIPSSLANGVAHPENVQDFVPLASPISPIANPSPQFPNALPSSSINNSQPMSPSGTPSTSSPPSISKPFSQNSTPSSSGTPSSISPVNKPSVLESSPNSFLSASQKPNSSPSISPPMSSPVQSHNSPLQDLNDSSHENPGDFKINFSPDSSHTSSTPSSSPSLSPSTSTLLPNQPSSQILHNIPALAAKSTPPAPSLINNPPAGFKKPTFDPHKLFTSEELPDDVHSEEHINDEESARTSHSPNIALMSPASPPVESSPPPGIKKPSLDLHKLFSSDELPSDLISEEHNSWNPAPPQLHIPPSPLFPKPFTNFGNIQPLSSPLTKATPPFPNFSKPSVFATFDDLPATPPSFMPFKPPMLHSPPVANFDIPITLPKSPPSSSQTDQSSDDASKHKNNGQNWRQKLFQKKPFQPSS